MKVIKNFETLYKRTNTDAIQEWNVSVCELDNGIASIVTRFGQLNGKIQESIKYVKSGKNIGKKNETTIVEQALLNAESMLNKQLKIGYVRSLEDAIAGNIDEDAIAGGIFPMLANVFSKQGHKIKYPAIAQPKLDGHRCTSQYEVDCRVTLWSRKRNKITSMTHITDVIEKCGIDFRLDGELYNHEYKDKFEELTEFIRNEKPTPGSEVLEYHVYDIADETLTNIERVHKLEELKDVFKNTQIKIVESIIVNNEDELMDVFQKFINDGYEGCMVRNFDALYEFRRSYNLQKIKEFDDSEFKIIGVKVSDNGAMAGKAIFTCELPNNETFDVKMVGKLDDLKQYADNPELVIGKILTVKYQGFTKYGKPRFPVGMRFRIDI